MRARLLTAPTVLATCLAAIAASAEASIGHPERSASRMIAAAAVATVLLIAAIRAFDRGEMMRARGLVIVQASVGVAFLYASGTDGFFVLLPTISVVYVTTTLLVTSVVVASVALTIVIMALAAGVPTGVVTGHALGFVGGAAFVTAFVRVALAEQRARAEVQRLTNTERELAAAEERNRIAREIHDGVGHALTAVHVHLEAAKALGRDEVLLASIERAREGTREALQEVRRSVGLMRASLVGSLVDAVHALGDEARQGGLDVDVRVEGEPRRLAPAIELALYRVAQEGITNVRRHAAASRATIALEFTSGAASVRVSDAGSGAALDEAPGFGLVGIRERAALLGGTVDVRSEPGRGFVLCVRVPA